MKPFCKEDHVWIEVYKTPQGERTTTIVKWCATCGCVSKKINYHEMLYVHTENLVPTYLEDK